MRAGANECSWDSLVRASRGDIDEIVEQEMQLESHLKSRYHHSA